ncbi:hypothetical protein LTR53_009077 [Teratosphaeriaceae sp. CCFEE 6253]|nr:hypothetical protein LTR53_009077 [Teratosphaeriaceae sp. CCFEE 6253]
MATFSPALNHAMLRSTQSPRSTTASPPKSPVASPRRPQPPRAPSSRSSDNAGWYHTADNLTLDDFAARLDTTLYRLAAWQTRCAQNVVMALMGPAPLVLFALNPMALVVWAPMLRLGREYGGASRGRCGPVGAADLERSLGLPARGVRRPGGDRREPGTRAPQTRRAMSSRLGAVGTQDQGAEYEE